VSKRKFDLIGYIDNRRKIIPTCIRASIGKKLFKTDKLMINVGSGVWYKPFWKSLDLYTSWYGGGIWWKKTIDYDYDLTSMKQLPFDDDSVDLFYSEYAFEHIPIKCSKYVFGEMHRCLKPGGGFRIIVPDMDIVYSKFNKDDLELFEHYAKEQDWNYSRAFLEFFAYPDTFDGEAFWKDFETLSKEKFFDKYTEGKIQKKDTAGHHISWFNFKKLHDILESFGFVDIKKTGYKETRFKEMKNKYFDTRPDYPGLFVDCEKGRNNGK